MNNLIAIKLKLNNGGTFACSETLKPFHTGVIVTKHCVVPAKYNAKVVYWLNSAEQTALFIPRHRLTPSISIATRVPVIIWRGSHGIETLCNNLQQLADAFAYDMKLTIEGDISPNALGISVIRYNNRFYAQELYSTVTNPGWHGDEIRLSHQQYEEETKMQDLTALLFGDELYAVTVTFQDNSTRRYTYKSLKEVEVGTKVVVDTPSNGFQVVTVVACKKGLDKQAQFEQYKWLVGVVDETEYRRLNDAEKDFIRKAKEEQAKREAILKLQALGVTADEYRAAVLGV